MDINKRQINRLEKLENQAVNSYLNKSDFNVVEWLDDEEQEEYCELYNMQFDEKMCICGSHTEWQ